MSQPVPELPEWITLGGQVAVTTFAYGVEDVSVETVEKITSTTVTTSGGSRFDRRKNLRAIGYTDPVAAPHRPELQPVDDPKVIELRRRVRIKRAAKTLAKRAKAAAEMSEPDSATFHQLGLYAIQLANTIDEQKEG